MRHAALPACVLRACDGVAQHRYYGNLFFTFRIIMPFFFRSLILAATATAAAASADANDVLWLPLGDSITWGCTGPTIQDCHGFQPGTVSEPAIMLLPSSGLP